MAPHKKIFSKDSTSADVASIEGIFDRIALITSLSWTKSLLELSFFLSTNNYTDFYAPINTLFY